MLEFSLDKDNENRLMVNRDAYKRLQVTFRVQPLFGFGDRNQSTDGEDIKKWKDKRSWMPKWRLRAVRPRARSKRFIETVIETTAPILQIIC